MFMIVYNPTLLMPHISIRVIAYSVVIKAFYFAELLERGLGISVVENVAARNAKIKKIHVYS